MSERKKLKTGLLIAGMVIIFLAITLVTYHKNVVTGAHSGEAGSEIIGDEPANTKLPPLDSITSADVAEPEESPN